MTIEYTEIRDYSMSHILPYVTSYHGHLMIAVSAKVRYIDKRHPKVHHCDVIFFNRKYIEETGLVHEYEYFRVKAWIGDNNTIHLMAPLPGETETELDLSNLFTVTPEQEDLDEKHRRMILGELLDKEDR